MSLKPYSFLIAETAIEMFTRSRYAIALIKNSHPISSHLTLEGFWLGIANVLVVFGKPHHISGPPNGAQAYRAVVLGCPTPRRSRAHRGAAAPATPSHQRAGSVHLS